LDQAKEDLAGYISENESLGEQIKELETKCYKLYKVIYDNPEI